MIQKSTMKPVHASPFEHCATPMQVRDLQNDKVNLPMASATWEKGITHTDIKGNMWSGNFAGWIQYRQLIQDNVCNNFVKE